MLASLVATRSEPLCAKSNGFLAFAANDGETVFCITSDLQLRRVRQRRKGSNPVFNGENPVGHQSESFVMGDEGSFGCHCVRGDHHVERSEGHAAS
jgi:hypothetical protein